MKELNCVSNKNSVLLLKYSDITYACSMTMVAFVEYCCTTYGTSISNNRKMCRNILDASQNLPICFSIVHDIIFLPTKSIRNENCVLINSNRIQSILPLSSKTSRVCFCDDTHIDIQCSKTTILMQIARAQQIRSFFARKISPIMKLKANHVIIV